ncbi:MAG: TM2 domain-containing protein [Alistipes sp.]|nr:TM2 domain-containing protein [Alistipes sp.]
MGFFDEDYDVRMAESYVKEAEAQLASAKRSRETAKANGNYRNSPKNSCLPNGKLGNSYDVNVLAAERALKEKRERLARAKEKAKDAKKSKKEEEQQRKQEGREEKRIKQEKREEYWIIQEEDEMDGDFFNVSSSSLSSSVVSASISTSLSNTSHTTSSFSASSFPKSESSSHSSRSEGTSLVVNESREHAKTTKAPRKWIITLLLCVFFGIFGGHRFYVGKIGTGILQFFTAGGYFVWAFVDLVHIVTGKFTDSKGNVIRVEL